MRPSDQIKEVRSYTVHRKYGGQIIVKPSHWQPGYTPGHKGTPREAIEYAMAEVQKSIDEFQQTLEKLHELERAIEEVPC